MKKKKVEDTKRMLRKTKANRGWTIKQKTGATKILNFKMRNNHKKYIISYLIASDIININKYLKKSGMIPLMYDSGDVSRRNYRSWKGIEIAQCLILAMKDYHKLIIRKVWYRMILSITLIKFSTQLIFVVIMLAKSLILMIFSNHHKIQNFCILRQALRA